ncbi:molybdopterin cofactor-binding domain-containing protein, partial [Xanthomonas euvesicatoria]|uniref:molybdopterin cofactor-binding domain-containing protein n=1 Tax=Xanthomonas euvesicatoria TaxID=456327 RepID=UPI0013DEF09E
ALVEVDYDPLDAVAGFEAAVAGGAPELYDTVPGNIVSHQVFASGRPEAIIASSEIIVEAAFSQHRVTHAPMETRGCIAEWDEGQQRLTFRVGNQAPHPLRSQLARRLTLDESQVRVVCPDIGGAFGQKIALLR